jgi:hypothetical protein
MISFGFNGVEAGHNASFSYCLNQTVTVSLYHNYQGTAPFSVTYTLDGGAPVTVSGNVGDILGGPLVLSGGVHNILVTDITDANGCHANAEFLSWCTATININRVTVSGWVKYYKPTSPLNLNATLTFTSPGGTYTASTTSGNYSVDLCPDQTYTVTITKNAPTTTGGVNATDAAQLNYWSLTPYPIPKAKFLACDVVAPFNYLLASDASAILQYFVTNGASPFAPGWAFWRTTDMVSANNPPSGPYTITINGNQSGVNFYGLVKGDFNNSYSPINKLVPEEKVKLNYTANKVVVPGNIFELPVKAVNSNTVGSGSIILDFPAEKLDIIDVTMNGPSDNSMQWAVNGNELRIGWYSAEPIILNRDQTLFTLKLRTHQELMKDEFLRFSIVSSDLNELSDASYQTISDAQLSINLITSPATSIGEPVSQQSLSLSNYPNPFKGSTTFVYSLPADGKASIEITNMLGEKVYVLNDKLQTTGDHTLTLDADLLRPGIYMATLWFRAGDVVYSRTIKIVQNQ